jgi:hypothetical protein
MTTVLEPLKGLEEHLARWVADGVVTPVQADLIRAEERGLAPAERPRRESVVTEALGYVGGLLVLVAGILLAAIVWEDLSTAARLTIVGGAAVLLGVVGGLMPARPASTGERLRSVLWVLATGASAFFLGLLASESFDLRGADVALMVTGGSAVVAAGFWRTSRLFPQQLAFFGLLAGTAAAALAEPGWTGPRTGSVPALGALAVALVWLLAAGRPPLVPVRASRTLGALGVVMASVFLQDWVWTRPVALACVVGLTVAATWWDDLGLLGMAAFGMLAVVPVSVSQWFPGEVSAPLALLVVGTVMVVLALRAVRRREHR